MHKKYIALFILLFLGNTSIVKVSFEDVYVKDSLPLSKKITNWVTGIMPTTSIISDSYNKTIASLHNRISKTENKIEKQNAIVLYKNYIVSGLTIGVALSIIAYYYDVFDIKNQSQETMKEIREIILDVLHNSAISKEQKLHKVFQELSQNGYDNIVVYNENLFDINDTFRVDIHENIVKVTIR